MASQHDTCSEQLCLQSCLMQAFEHAWPSWNSVMSNATVRLAANLSEQTAALGLPEDPASIILKSRERITKRKQCGKDVFPDIWRHLEASIVSFIYGSNQIESAGSTLRITTDVCQAVFRGHPVSFDINEHDASSSYEEHIQALFSSGRKPDRPNVVQSRLEVILHAKAFTFMVNRIVLIDEPWTEELILQTHEIMYGGLVNHDDVVAGRYRDHEVAVSYKKPGEKLKKSICIRAKAVSAYMSDMIKHLNKEISEDTTVIDPYTLAARYHNQFVMIHPFGDGNGRVSRIILNVLLLKYAGHVAPFGGQDCEKEEYLNIVRRGHRIFQQEDMEVDFEDQTSHLEFAKFVLVKSRRGFEDMCSWGSQ